jgi:NADH-quinone oxidoreductase subunit E
MTFSDQLEKRFTRLLASYPQKRSALVPMLMYAQDEVGALTPEVIAEIARRLDITTLAVEEVIGYYSMMHKKPQGRRHLQICTNISCMLTGGTQLWELAQKKLGLKNKQVTADGKISIEEVECIGACCWAPAIQVNYDFHHKVTPESLDRLIEELRKGE